MAARETNMGRWSGSSGGSGQDGLSQVPVRHRAQGALNEVLMSSAEEQQLSESGPLPDPVLTPRLADALGLAIQLHALQRRKGTSIPYLSHLLAVSAVVLEHGGTEDQAIAGLLHDAAEDGPDNVPGLDGEMILAAIAERFGNDVADIVRACSDTTVHPKPPWRERKEQYLAHLEAAIIDVVVVSAADKLHNLSAIGADFREIGENVFERFNADAASVRWYYAELVRIFTDRLDETRPRLVSELQRALDAIQPKES
jgi:(p)ppGpp synthase/HD superfamily hydrolase